jgi:hypothetical protein
MTCRGTPRGGSRATCRCSRSRARRRSRPCLWGEPLGGGRGALARRPPRLDQGACSATFARWRAASRAPRWPPSNPGKRGQTRPNAAKRGPQVRYGRDHDARLQSGGARSLPRRGRALHKGHVGAVHREHDYLLRRADRFRQGEAAEGRGKGPLQPSLFSMPRSEAEGFCTPAVKPPRGACVGAPPHCPRALPFCPPPGDARHLQSWHGFIRQLPAP